MLLLLHTHSAVALPVESCQRRQTHPFIESTLPTWAAFQLTRARFAWLALNIFAYLGYRAYLRYVQTQPGKYFALIKQVGFVAQLGKYSHKDSTCSELPTTELCVVN